MEDPYNCEVRPTNEWILDNCAYSLYDLGYYYKNERIYDKILFRNNKCKMLNNEWKLVQWENDRKEKILRKMDKELC